MTQILIYFKKTNQTFKLELKKFHKFPIYKTIDYILLNIVLYHL